MPEPHPEKPTDTVDNPRAALDRLLEDQRQCWQRGEPRPVEAYRAEWGTLLNDGAALLDVIFQEILLRGEGGETVRVEEYERRFPDLASEIRLQFAVDGAVFSSPPTVHPPEPEVPVLADYEILGVLGQGGMGVVYKARQRSLNRLVALKVIRARGTDTAEVMRFRREAEATAQMDHPNIVPIYEVGVWQPSGDSLPTPYFTLKYLEGGSLARRKPRGEEGQYPSKAPWDLREAAALVVKIARGVQYAHERGVLHRDLKPANVLLDERGEPLVTDFGLAKRVEGETALTQSGAIVGTPGYMAPEQARGGTSALTTAADIHGLGAILFELLTGQPPFRGETPLATILLRCENEAPSPRQLNPRVNRDMEAICRKCLEKEPTMRYASATALADDLERWLRGEVIEALPATPTVRARKWARRNPVIAALVTALILSVLAGVVGTVTYAARAGQRAVDAELAEEEARQRTLEAWDLAEVAEKRAAEALESRTRVEESAQLARRHLYTAHMALAQRAWEEKQLGTLRRLLERQRPEETGGEDLRGFEWHYWHRLSHEDLLTISVGRGMGGSAAFAEGGRLVTAGTDGLQIWEEATGRLQGKIPLPEVLFTTLDRRGQRLLVLSRPQSDFTLAGWAPDTGKQLWSRVLRPPFYRPVLSPDGRFFACSDGTGKIHLGDAATGETRFEIAHNPQDRWHGAFRGDGQRFAYSAPDPNKPSLDVLKILDMAHGQVVQAFPPGVYQALTFTHDGQQLAVAGGLDGVNVFAVAGGAKVTSFLAPGGTSCLAASPEGSTVAAAQVDRTLGLFVAGGYGGLGSYLAHDEWITDLAYRRDGRRLVSVGSEGTAKIWDPSGGHRPRVSLGIPSARVPPRDPDGALPDEVFQVVFHPKNRTLAFACGEGTVALYEPGVRPRRIPLGGGPVRSVAFAPDGGSWAAAADTTAVLMPDQGLLSKRLEGLAPRASRIAYNRTGTLVATGARGEVKVWNATSGVLQGTIPLSDPAPPNGLAYGADDRLAICDARGLTVWDAQGRKQFHYAPSQIMHWRGRDVAFHPDGKRLATAHEDRTVRLWDPDSRTEPILLGGHEGVVVAVAFSPDGRRLASVSDRTVRLWDVATRQETLLLKADSTRLTCVAFSPEGLRLAAGTQGGAWIWDGTPREMRAAGPTEGTVPRPQGK